MRNIRTNPNSASCFFRVRLFDPSAHVGRRDIRHAVGALGGEAPSDAVELAALVLPVLQSVIAASPTGDLTFLATEYGRPFTANGFGNKFGEWCDEAGLPHCTSHGLRKAGAAMAAENGAIAHQLMSIFGWLTLKEAERYTRAAEQKRLAEGAMSLVERTST